MTSDTCAVAEEAQAGVMARRLKRHNPATGCQDCEDNWSATEKGLYPCQLSCCSSTEVTDQLYPSDTRSKQQSDQAITRSGPHLGGVDDAGLDQVLNPVVHRVVPLLEGLAQQLLHDDLALHARVVRDQPRGRPVAKQARERTSG